MKRCPKCTLDYEDNTLEFCLQDGTRLVSVNNFNTEIPTIARTARLNSTTEKTASLPAQSASMPLNDANINRVMAQTTLFREKAREQSYRILEKSTIVVALAHNWWQWIYLNNQSYTSFTAYIFSANFLIWLALLAGGVILGLMSLKRNNNRNFAVTGLVILAVNCILFLVPKH